VFSGVSPLPAAALGSAGRFKAHTALVHADAATPDVAELIGEMAQRTTSGYVFGGLASSRFSTVQFALSGHGNMKGQGAATGVFSGGLSGVAFARGAALMSRVTQGCRPVSVHHHITACDANVVTELDGQPALDVMLSDLGVSLEQPHKALARVRSTLVGLSCPADTLNDAAIQHAGQFGAEVMVRHLIGLDPARKAIAIAEAPIVGMKLAFCERNAEAARADLIRVCAEIREELEPQEVTLEVASALSASAAESAPHVSRRIAGAIYVSCSGRGGAHFGGPSAELQVVRRALGDVPLVGFFAGGEIARHQLYGYTGVLTVFTAGG
jgi:small ligand-binding sensory domain FIST